MPHAVPVHYTIADYEHWEGDWELIEGIPVAMSPAPVLQHQRLTLLLMMALENSLENCEQCLAYPEAEWRLNEDTVFRPDGVVVGYKPDRYLQRRPELIIEVISPATAAIDEQYKFERCAREGVKYYILAYPDKKIANVHQLCDGGYVKVDDSNADGATFNLGPCQAYIDFGKVFRRLD